MNNKLNLSHEQQNALSIMLSGQNVFLTGFAGTGKSTVVHEFIRCNNKNLVSLAPTGTAAHGIQGVTIHSLFKFPIDVINEDMLFNAAIEQRVLLSTIDVILVDEISMVRAEIFQAMDSVLRKCGDAIKPFGGKQIIVVGDFSQLPPVVNKLWITYELKRRFGSEFAFDTPAWMEANFINIILKEVHRQDDDKYIDILNFIRQGGNNFGALERFKREVLRQLNQMCRTGLPDNAVALCCTRQSAKEINANAHHNLQGESQIFRAKISDTYPKDMCSIDDVIKLKVGEQVMLLKNKYETHNNYMNGDMGTIIKFGKLVEPVVYVQLKDGRKVMVFPETWYSYIYRLGQSSCGDLCLKKSINGSYTQIPLCPAAGLTIHRVQGQTLDKIHIVPGTSGFFSPWQLYVAASRVRNIDCLSLERPITEDDLNVDIRVTNFYQQLKV